jgi:hypothetical protein
LGILVILLFIVCGIAGAQVTLSLTPLRVELSVSPGSTRTFTILLINESKSSTARFKVKTMDLTQKPNGDYQVVELGESKHSCASWIKLSTDNAVLGPGEALSLIGTVAVPRTAYGGKYAAVVMELVPDERAPGDTALASARFVHRMATVVELSVQSPRVKRLINIEGFTLESASQNDRLASAYGNDALMLSAQVKNEGNIHALVQGTLTLRDSTGRRLRQIPLGAGRGLVLPDASVRLSSILPAGLKPGDYIADLAFKYGGTRPAVAKVPFTVGPTEAGATADAEGIRQTVIAPFTAEPSEVALSYPAGAVVARSVVLENKSDQAIRVEGKPLPLEYDVEGELVQEGLSETESSCAQWIELRPASLQLAPRSRQVVRIVISIPKGEAGGKYADLVFAATPVDGAGWTGEAGTTVFLTVGKESPPQAEIAGLDLRDGGPSVGHVFEATLRNTGTTHLKPSTVFTLFKRVMPESVPGLEYIGPGSLVEVYSADLGESENVVLPGGERILRTTYAQPLEVGEYVLEVAVRYGAKTPAYATLNFAVK